MKYFDAKLSDDGLHVLIFYEGFREPEEIRTEDFVEDCGIEALKDIMTEAQRVYYIPELNAANLEEYYRAIIDSIDKSSRVAILDGLYAGVIDNSESAWKTFRRHFNNEKSLIAKIVTQRIIYSDSLKKISEASKNIGYGSIPLNSTRENEFSLSQFSELLFTKKHFRKKLRHKIKKYAAEGVACPLDRLVTEALASYRKK